MDAAREGASAERPGSSGPSVHDPRGSTNLRALRIAAVVLPVSFVVGLELVRQLAVVQGAQDRVLDLVLLVIVLLGIVAFSAMVFRIVGRTQEQLARRNRELAAANAVSGALRGALDLDDLLDAALDSVIAATGATEASILRFGRHSRWNDGSHTVRSRTSSAHPVEQDGSGATREIPLTTGATTVGTLRLRLPADADPRDDLASETLETIGQQLAGAIQTAELMADLKRGMLEGHGFYDVLLQISSNNPLPDVLAAVVHYARSLLASEEAVLTLNAATVRTLQVDTELADATALGDGSMCFTPDPEHVGAAHSASLVCPVRSMPHIKQSVTTVVRGPDGTFGDLWLGRHHDTPYDEGDRRFLATLAELSSIAIANARLRGRERDGAIVAERERIAREMHDGMAQVLGVTHLRLRALETSTDVRSHADLHAEVTDLAELCFEAYGDVRENILGLRESSRVDLSLMDSLRAYVEKYSRQSGIPTTLDADRAAEVELPLRYQVQVLRVVQEALTNVRKHAGASRADVAVLDDGVLVTFVVSDDGHGFQPSALAHGRDGFGLHSMRERMELLGGTLTIDSEPGRGTRVVAAVPSPVRARRVTEARRVAE